MPAPPQQLQPRSSPPSKFLHRPIRHKRIILRMKHHDLRPCNFIRMINGTIKFPIPQLLPIPIRKPVPISKCLADVRRIIRIRSLFALLARQNSPIHHRTICHHSFHPRIQRTKQRRRPAKASANHENLRSGHPKPSPKRQFPKLALQSPNHIQNIQLRRSFQKFSRTLPSPAIPRIEDPVSRPGKKLRQRLLPRNRRHPIAQNNHPLFFHPPRWRKKLRDNLPLKSSSKHLCHEKRVLTSAI